MDRLGAILLEIPRCARDDVGNCRESLMSLIKKFKKFYRSPENRIQFHLFLGFVIVPVVGMTLLYLYVITFWIH